MLVPTITAVEAREIGVPDMEMAGAPGSRVAPPMVKPVGFAV